MCVCVCVYLRIFLPDFVPPDFVPVGDGWCVPDDGQGGDGIILVQPPADAKQLGLSCRLYVSFVLLEGILKLTK